MAGVKDGFGVTIGVILAVCFVMAMSAALLIGGCGLLFVGATGAVSEATRAAREVEAKRKAKELADSLRPPPEMQAAEQELADALDKLGDAPAPPPFLPPTPQPETVDAAPPSRAADSVGPAGAGFVARPRVLPEPMDADGQAAEPEPSPLAADTSSSEPAPSEATGDADRDDAAAENALKLARKLRLKNPEAYRRRLQDLIAKHPNTPAASEASKELSIGDQ